MNCIICSGKMNFYFIKNFNESTDFDKMFNLGKVEYFKCINCGFVSSKTHQEMDETAWQKLNHDFHTFIENPRNKKNNNQPPYVQIALLIKVLLQNNIIKKDILDFGAGMGTLSQILKKYLSIEISIYDDYIQKINKSISYLTKDKLAQVEFDSVLTSAVFEHITQRNHIDRINSLVNKTGTLVIHTLICENVPSDPSWFYLLPVHTAFYTNRSMRILMDDWNYKCSIYSIDAKSWVLFKKCNEIEEKIKMVNQEFQNDYLIFSKGFVDYWKTF